MYYIIVKYFFRTATILSEDDIKNVYAFCNHCRDNKIELIAFFDAKSIDTRMLKPLEYITPEKMADLVKAYGGEECRRFIDELTPGKIQNLSSWPSLFSYIKDVGGEKLGKFWSLIGPSYGIPLEGTAKVNYDLKQALHIDNKNTFIDLVRNGSPTSLQSMVKNFGGRKLHVLKVRKGMYTRCNAWLTKLTELQTVLLKKLTPDQAQELSQKVKIHYRGNQIEFLQTDRGALIISYRDGDKKENPLKPDFPTWRLPQDKNSRFSEEERLRLDPTLSDLDAMIVQMPGETESEKVENFMLLTGMEGCYVTRSSGRSLSGDVNTKDNSMPIVRTLSKDGVDRNLMSAFVPVKKRFMRVVKV